MAAAEIYRRWARARQVRIRPEKRTWSNWFLFSMGILFGVSFIALPWLDSAYNVNVRPISVVGGAGVIIGTLLLMCSMPRNFAVVRAVSLDEFRKDRDVRNRHWMTATIALTGVVVALLSVLVTVLLKK